MWVCRRHKDENNPALRKFKDEIHTKHGLQFAFLATIPGFRSPIIAGKTSVAKEPGIVGDNKAKTTNVKQAKIVKAVSPRKLKLQKVKMMTKSRDVETVQVKEVKSDFISPGTAPIAANTVQKSLSPNQALKKLKKKMNASGINEEQARLGVPHSRFKI